MATFIFLHGSCWCKQTSLMVVTVPITFLMSGSCVLIACSFEGGMPCPNVPESLMPSEMPPII